MFVRQMIVESREAPYSLSDEVKHVFPRIELPYTPLASSGGLTLVHLTAGILMVYCVDCALCILGYHAGRRNCGLGSDTTDLDSTALDVLELNLAQGTDQSSCGRGVASTSSPSSVVLVVLIGSAIPNTDVRPALSSNS